MLIEINSLEEIKGENFIIFKHSIACPVSSSAKMKVDEFVKNKPHIPVYMNIVQNNQDLKRAIADTYNIKHQTPQVIIFKEGKIIATESHHSIQLLEKFFE